MANQDCSMLENQTPDGENEIQEAASVGQGGMVENGEYESMLVEVWRRESKTCHLSKMRLS